MLLTSSGFIGPLSILCQILAVDLTDKIYVVCHKTYIVEFILERGFQ